MTSAIILVFAALLAQPFDLCCTELVDGELACHDIQIDKAPECEWVTSCWPTMFGLECANAGLIRARSIDDWRCCEESDDLGDLKLTFTDCVEPKPVIGWVPWCPDATLSMAVTCHDPWVLDLETNMWACLG